MNVRVLVLGRLFSGLKDGIAHGCWQPRGVPAFCNMVEALAADPDIHVRTVLAAKEPDERFAKRTRMNHPAVGAVDTLPWYRPTAGRLRRWDIVFNEIVQAICIVWVVFRFRPHVVYATFATVPVAAILAWFGHRGVVLRLMGVFPYHRSIAANRGGLFRLLMRAPFAHIVCSEDGSDPSVVLPKLVRADVPVSLRLNGCDTNRPAEAAIAEFRRRERLDSRPVALFLGRLEAYKGADLFVDAALEIARRAPDLARFVIVGEGSLLAELEDRVAAADATGAVYFAGARNHAEALMFLAASDLYASVNLHGNLSNANLEAIAAGIPMLVPSSDLDIPIDTSTDALIPETAARRYDRKEQCGAIADAMEELLSDPTLLKSMRKAVAELQPRLLRPWRACIDDDIEILRQVAAEPERSERKAHVS